MISQNLEIYGSLIICAFILLPFSYFYCEQKQKDFDEDMSMDTTSTSYKFFKSLKHTVNSYYQYTNILKYIKHKLKWQIIKKKK